MVVEGEIMSCICDNCEMLRENEPIKVIDWKSNSPFGMDLYHFEDGFRCCFNGEESLRKEDLSNHGCRLRGGM